MSNFGTNFFDKNSDFIPSSPKIINNEHFDPKNFSNFPRQNNPQFYDPYQNEDPKEIITFPNTESIFEVVIGIIEQRNQEKKHFQTKKYSHRGPAPSKPLLTKKHGRSDFDNILTKIQVNFINFLINLTNDAVNTEFTPDILKNLVINDNNNKKDSEQDFFRYINYDIKKKIDHNYITNIFQKPIKDILILDVSQKYKKLQSQSRLDYNKILYEKLIEKSEWLKEFLDLKYIDVFIKYYYNQLKPLHKIEFQGKTIVISKKTKSFYYLLQKEKVISLLMIDEVKSVYFNECNSKNPFITTKKDN
jgi:hypothetical protein